MLFLLKDDEGRPLLIAETGSRAEAEMFARSHLRDFRGETVELDIASRRDAEEFWGVRTVRVKGRGRCNVAPAAAVTYLWVRGPRLPEEVETDDLLTGEDHRDLTLDHIGRTSDVVAQIEIRKRASDWVR